MSILIADVPVFLTQPLQATAPDLYNKLMTAKACNLELAKQECEQFCYEDAG
ncbi:MAG: hypothetical protein KME21_17535 [Desmonostoc vinosum HA7617-LM4]|nr:hypothetical protein [Desmonostoc vinosum HA7617-LM4]